MAGAIYFVTGNEGKRREVETLLGGCGVTVRNIKLEVPELQGPCTQEIARRKCLWAYEHAVAQGLAPAGSTVMTEDTSLEFAALKGLPGPYIKWFLEAMGNDELHLLVAGFECKEATARTCLCLYNGTGESPWLIEGTCAGRVVAPRGRREFGWDPNFEPAAGAGLTYGEMSKEAKNAVSHRAAAMQKLRASLEAGLW